MRLLILADDLSGAADAGLACAEAGLETHVILGGRDGDADVLCVDADTRHLPPEQAAEVTAQLLTRHAVPGAAVFKKIDSTLRGNWPAELAALLGHGGAGSRAILAPAFPGVGRTVQGGRVSVHGIALAETEIWRHENRSGSAVPAEMLSDIGISAVTIDRSVVRGPARVLAAALREAPTVAICDAETEADLAAIAAAGAALGERRLWCGSGGLMQALPAALGLAGMNLGRPVVSAVTRPILFLVGSRSALAMAQRAHLLARGVVAVTVTDGNETAAADHGRKALAAGQDILVTLNEGMHALRDAETPCQRLARFAGLFTASIGALVATGGETARAALEQQGATGIHLLGAVAPGVPLGRIDGPWPLPCVTKAGAFGSEDILSQARDVLRSGRDRMEGPQP